MSQAPRRHQQSNRQLQERLTALPVADVISEASRFFTRRGGVYSAFVDKQGPSHIVLRGQGGEELVIAARVTEGGTAVSGSSYLFDQQISRFLDSLPVALVAVLPNALPDGAPTPAALPERVV